MVTNLGRRSAPRSYKLFGLIPPPAGIRISLKRSGSNNGAEGGAGDAIDIS